MNFFEFAHLHPVWAFAYIFLAGGAAVACCQAFGKRR